MPSDTTNKLSFLRGFLSCGHHTPNCMYSLMMIMTRRERHLGLAAFHHHQRRHSKQPEAKRLLLLAHWPHYHQSLLTFGFCKCVASGPSPMKSTRKEHEGFSSNPCSQTPVPWPDQPTECSSAYRQINSRLTRHGGMDAFFHAAKDVINKNRHPLCPGQKCLP